MDAEAVGTRIDVVGGAGQLRHFPRKRSSHGGQDVHGDDRRGWNRDELASNKRRANACDIQFSNSLDVDSCGGARDLLSDV